MAHNSHIGNAAATDMGKARDEINIGQLCREKFGDGAALIGLGTVAAADDWDGPMKVKTVHPAHPESYEYLKPLSAEPKQGFPETYPFGL